MNSHLQIRKGLLKRMRDSTGISSEQAQARLLGVGISTIRRIDAGEQPSAGFIVAFCMTYNMGIGEAFEIVPARRAQADQAA